MNKKYITEIIIIIIIFQIGSARPTIGVVLCWEGDCENGGKCKEPSSSFRCDCKSGWQGIKCQENVDECTSLSEPCFVSAYNIVVFFSWLDCTRKSLCLDVFILFIF